MVTGTHFTPFAQITVNDEVVETVFVSETELRTAFVPEDGDLISVCFVGENPVVLSQTDSVTY